MSVSVSMSVSLSMFVSVGVGAVFTSVFNAHVHSVVIGRLANCRIWTGNWFQYGAQSIALRPSTLDPSTAAGFLCSPPSVASLLKCQHRKPGGRTAYQYRSFERSQPCQMWMDSTFNCMFTTASRHTRVFAPVPPCMVY
jgi:hypothetical protein